jgi:hypothetical protein
MHRNDRSDSAYSIVPYNPIERHFPRDDLLMTMINIAQIAFDHIWMILFADEDTIDLDYSANLIGELSLSLPKFTMEERDAMASVAQHAKDRLLAEPDEYGYTPRDLVTNEQRDFLDATIAKEIYNEDWWSD